MRFTIMIRMSHRAFLSGAFASLCPLIGASPASFETQRDSIAAAMESQQEAAIRELLKAGIAENLPAPAVALAGDWMRRNLPKESATLFQAARAAELAGEIKNAVAYHQQALRLADPRSAEAGESIIAVHTLLIHRLDDPAAAYAFAHNEAARLAVNPRFRQFDRWFLNEARTRGDYRSAASRLHASIKGGLSQDHLVALYGSELKWLLDAIRAVRYDLKPDRFSDDFTLTVKALAAAVRYDEEYRLLLDWSVSVKAYNMARIDGRDAKAPHAEAKALLDRFPRYAALVQTDWAGGSNSRHYRDDPKRYWPHEVEAKLTPLRALLPRLPPLEQADLLQTWSSGYYDSGPQIIAPSEVPAFILANKDLVNRITGPILNFDFSKITPAQAAELAPHLVHNPSPDAAVIRAFAAIGETKDLDKAIAALLGPESWRLDRIQLDQAGHADRLWHMTGQPGGQGKRGQVVAQSKALAQSIPAQEPESQFAVLRNDYLSPAPKTPALRSRLAKLLNESPDLVASALADDRIEIQILVRSSILNDLGNPNGVLKTKANQNKKRINPKPVDPHPLEPELRDAVQSSLSKNKLESWLVSAWVRTLNGNRTTESIRLAESILGSPALVHLNHEAQLGLRAQAPEKALTPAQFALRQSADPALACSDLLQLPATANAAAAIAAVTKAIAAANQSPAFLEIQGLDSLAAIPAAAFEDEALQSLLVGLIDQKLLLAPPRLFADRLFPVLVKRNRPDELLRGCGFWWRHVSVHMRTYPAMMTLAESSLESGPSVSYAYALEGLAAIERHRQGHTWFNREADIPRLKSIRSKAAMKLGLVVIPVAADHPNYPVYQSQAEWLSGNEDSAWNLVHSNWESFAKIHRELTFSYLMWVLNRTTYARDDAGQEFLIKALLAWSSEKDSALTPSEKAGIDLTYGDIALLRGQVRQAHEIYSRVQKNPAYSGLPARHEAALRRVRAERMAKNYDAALQTLADLEMERIPEIWSEMRFARAEIRFDMEEFEDAKEDIDSILDRDPNHPDARILLGKVQLRRKKLMEATEVEIGSAAGKTSLVPGESLKVTLSDPTLAVSGAGTETEVVVRATSGDQETFFLRQFGDEKTKFRGEIPTALGAPVPADGILQVVGDDEVSYGYSDGFRRKMNLDDEKRGGPITIASDAVLMASSRKLLTEAEQRAADMQEMMDQIGFKGRVSSAAANARWAQRSISGTVDSPAEIASSKRIDSIAKPGNPLHVRVVDPDRGRSAGIDELSVAATASSGDSVSAITLRETGTHTGVFEGTVPTTGAQAQALADHSEPGRSPNMVISPRTDYPAWKPVAAKGAVPAFTVDFNDQHPLAALTITAREPGAALSRFIVQTAMNAGDWTSVATWPATPTAVTDPWKPSVMVVNEGPNKAHYGARSVYEIGDLRQHMSTGWLAHLPEMAIAQSLNGISDALPASILKDVKWKRGPHDNPAVVVRYNAWFHEKDQVKRRFSLKLGPAPKSDIKADERQQKTPPEFLIAVDGKVITHRERGDLIGELDLEPGIHRIEIWATGWVGSIGFGRKVSLLSNLTDPHSLTECPDSFFDPARFPSTLLDHRNNPATVEAAGAGEFRVKFAKDSKARMIRLLLVGQEGPVPALNKLTLTRPDGKSILPVAEDFADLNKNQILEILTGDRIFVRYLDDRFITKAKQRHERMLSVSFTDARAEFADMEPRFDSRHQEDRPYYERLLRFVHDKPLSLAIHDADMDSTVNPDKVKVALDTDSGQRVFDAVETGDSTGVFKLVVTPVTGPAAGHQLQVAPGGVITASYLDQENNRPGVPAKRVATIQHAAFTPPQLVFSHSKVAPIVGTSLPLPLHHGFDPLTPETEQARESLRPRWSHQQEMLPHDKPPEGGFQAALGQKVLMEIIAPQLALGVESSVDVYVQSDSSRRAAGQAQGEFDINAPGTVLLRGILKEPQFAFGERDGTPLLPIYQQAPAVGLHDNRDADRFLVSVPLILGVLPPYGALTFQEFYDLRKRAATELGAEPVPESIAGLVVRPGENMHIGFRYTDATGATRWLTATSRVVSHPVLDIMDEEFHSTKTSAFVGENLHLRVVDAGADSTDAPDVVPLLVQAKSGAKQTVELHESGPHTGIFKGQVPLAYASKPPQTPAPSPSPSPSPPDGDAGTPPSLADAGLAVVYGDTVAARYTDPKGVRTETLMVTVSKGADGSIEPFSKQYDDPQIAMRTQFSLAESYLELAKRHRKLNEKEAAELGFETAKQLLSKAMDQFTDPDTRAHAEYLLGTLTMEDADVTGDADLRETRYRAALSRFLNITGTYPQAIHASKAQYQIATIYERLKEPEIAAQEYVKLAYKYPDSEFLAVSMARLGTHFLKKASEYEAKAKPLLDKAKAEASKDAGFEGDALMKMAVAEYLKTATIFGRLQERFPSDPLAGQAGLRAGQAYMRAGRNQDAIDAFQKVIAEEGYDGKTIRAQAMYWSGMSFQALKQPLAAYSAFKRLTYDFPESEWAAFARGQLSQEGMLDLETKLELERLEGEK